MTLTDHVRLHRLLMAVLGRLVDFSGLWERDLYFVTLALLYEAGLRPQDVFEEKGLAPFRDGRIAEALDGLKDAEGGRRLRDAIERHFGRLFKQSGRFDGASRPNTIRNGFAHFNMLRPRKVSGGASVFEVPNLSACVNDARDLMGYDRKLKNAVSQSVIEWLAREGLTLAWTMGGDHRLCEATVATSQARHLAKKVQGGAAAGPVVEDLNGRGFVEMTAALFGGAAAQASEPPSAAQKYRPDPRAEPGRSDNSSRRAGRLTPRSQ